jgi:hypothetical protein
MLVVVTPTMPHGSVVHDPPLPPAYAQEWSVAIDDLMNIFAVVVADVGDHEEASPFQPE